MLSRACIIQYNNTRQETAGCCYHLENERKSSSLEANELKGILVSSILSLRFHDNTHR